MSVGKTQQHPYRQRLESSAGEGDLACGGAVPGDAEEGAKVGEGVAKTSVPRSTSGSAASSPSIMPISSSSPWPS